ncbi:MULTISPECIES: hypothetical protein [Paenibacillus]|nr:hypothetical protein [Paenibacillus odorifer]
MLRWVGGVYCGGSLGVRGSLLLRTMDTWSILRSSLGVWGEAY